MSAAPAPRSQGLAMAAGGTDVVGEGALEEAEGAGVVVGVEVEGEGWAAGRAGRVGAGVEMVKSFSSV